MPNEIGKCQVCDFPPKNDGRGIKKKNDDLNNANSYKVNEVAPAYTPSNQTKLKVTPSINSTMAAINASKTNVPHSNITSSNQTTKEETTTISPLKTPDSQYVNSQLTQFSTVAVQKAVREFAGNLQEGVAKEILMNYPVELKGKDTITLFLNHAEYENAISQIKYELLAFLQQNFANSALEFNIRKPYTDSEKLYFLKQKYAKVNVLADKLGLDLM